MRITEAGFTILPTPHTQAEILKHIERCGRVCYKSEDKITEDSAQQFVTNIIKRGHEAVLEHGSLCVRMPQIMESLSRRTAVSTEEWYAKAIVRMESHYDGGTLYRNYLRFFHDGYKTRPVISGNIRAWRSFFKAYQEQLGQIPLELHSLIQLNTVLLGQFLPYAAEGTGVVAGIEWPEHLCTSARLVHQDVSVLFTVDRGISPEIVRHRLASYCQESTRYCDYSVGRFGSEITVIEPKALRHTPGYKIWMDSCKRAETAYFDLLDCGCSPQEARGVLPNSLKTEIVMTANLAEWRHFFQLRTSRAAHPQMREVAIPLLREFKKRDPENFCDIQEDKA